jgi:hypothetical protein
LRASLPGSYPEHPELDEEKSVDKVTGCIIWKYAAFFSLVVLRTPVRIRLGKDRTGIPIGSLATCFLTSGRTWLAHRPIAIADRIGPLQSGRGIRFCTDSAIRADAEHPGFAGVFEWFALITFRALAKTFTTRCANYLIDADVVFLRLAGR